MNIATSDQDIYICPFYNLKTVSEIFLKPCRNVKVAQLAARPTGDQEVVGSTPAGSATFFRGDLIILSLPLIHEGQVSVSGERMCTILVNHLED